MKVPDQLQQMSSPRGSWVTTSKIPAGLFHNNHDVGGVLAPLIMEQCLESMENKWNIGGGGLGNLIGTNVGIFSASLMIVLSLLAVILKPSCSAVNLCRPVEVYNLLI